MEGSEKRGHPVSICAQANPGQTSSSFSSSSTRTLDYDYAYDHQIRARTQALKPTTKPRLSRCTHAVPTTERAAAAAAAAERTTLAALHASPSSSETNQSTVLLRTSRGKKGGTRGPLSHSLRRWSDGKSRLRDHSHQFLLKEGEESGPEPGSSSAETVTSSTASNVRSPKTGWRPVKPISEPSVLSRTGRWRRLGEGGTSTRGGCRRRRPRGYGWST